jgi:hypothetical protein
MLRMITCLFKIFTIPQPLAIGAAMGRKDSIVGACFSSWDTHGPKLRAVGTISQEFPVTEQENSNLGP